MSETSVAIDSMPPPPPYEHSQHRHAHTSTYHPQVFAAHRVRILSMYGMSMLVMLVSGSQYAFSAYGPSIKTKLGFFQSEIELVSTLGNIGAYLGPITGILIALFHPRTTLLIGTLSSFIGYGAMGTIMMSSSATYFQRPGWLGMSLFMGGFGSGLMYGTCLAANVHNIPPHRRGLSVAILVSLFGLSATIFTGIFMAFSTDHVGQFLLTIALIILGVGLVAAFTVKRIDFTEDLALTRRTSISTTDLVSSYYRADDLTESTPINRYLPPSPPLDGDIQLPTLSSRIIAAQDITLHPITRVWMSLLALIRETTFWLMFLVFTLVAGCGLMQINNMGELVKSLNGGVEDHTYTLTCITIFSLGNCGGRLIMAFSDYTTYRRAWWLSGTATLMMIGHLLQAYVFVTKQLVIGSALLIGLAYGGLWSIMPIITSEAFGTINFPINYGWLGVSPGIASAIFNSVAGALYQAQIASDAKNCIGPNCYRYAFVFASIASGLGALVALLLVSRTQPGKKYVKPFSE